MKFVFKLFLCIILDATWEKWIASKGAAGFVTTSPLKLNSVVLDISLLFLFHFLLLRTLLSLAHICIYGSCKNRHKLYVFPQLKLKTVGGVDVVRRILDISACISHSHSDFTAYWAFSLYLTLSRQASYFRTPKNCPAGLSSLLQVKLIL